MIFCKTQEFDTINGQKITLITITLADKTNIQLTNFGGIVHKWECLDKHGILGDVLLGRTEIVGYLEPHPYFGTITGRYANRIAFGKFTIHNKQYQLATNLPPHHLHGGLSGLDKKIWDFDIVQNADNIIVTMTTSSPDSEEGYPGNLSVTVKYTITTENELIIEYFAETDVPTPVNLTNHCYFNLSGKQDTDILDHEVYIDASSITSVDETLIPTGEFTNINGTALDFQQSKKISDHIFEDMPLLKIAKGYDHNFVLNQCKSDKVKASAYHKESGRRLQVFTDQPAIQLYTGNHLGSTEGKSVIYKDYAGLCLETQHFPDSPNHEHFPNTILSPGQTFYSITKYKMDII